MSMLFVDVLGIGLYFLCVHLTNFLIPGRICAFYKPYALILHISYNKINENKNSDVLGPVEEVGASLAAKRNAKLIAAQERQTDGILFYLFDFALDDGTHQILQLCVNKGKIWSLDANTKEKRYAKRKEMYYNILGSFMPKLS